MSLSSHKEEPELSGIVSMHLSPHLKEPHSASSSLNNLSASSLSSNKLLHHTRLAEEHGLRHDSSGDGDELDLMEQQPRVF
jgi:hypothetical protein